MTDELDDDGVMSLVQSGDVNSIAILFGRHNSMLVRFLKGKLRDLGTAEDVAQDAWIRVQEVAASYLPSGQFTAWVRRIALNMVVDMKRKSSQLKMVANHRSDDRSLVEDAADDRIDPIEQWITKDQADQIEKLLPLIPEDQQMTFSLHVFAGMTLGDIADRLGESRATIKSRYRLAKEKLLEAYSKSRIPVAGAA